MTELSLWEKDSMPSADCDIYRRTTEIYKRGWGVDMLAYDPKMYNIGPTVKIKHQIHSMVMIVPSQMNTLQRYNVSQ